MQRRQKKTAGLPVSPGRPTDTVKIGDRSNKFPVITPDVYRLLMDVIAPIPVNHRSCHADMIKNVVLEDLRGRIDELYNQDGN